MTKMQKRLLLSGSILLLLTSAFAQQALELAKVSITVSNLERAVDFYIVEFGDESSGRRRGFLLRGPDGHALLLYE